MMEVKLPKPGDQLPFVVAEWAERNEILEVDEEFLVEYQIDGRAVVYGKSKSRENGRYLIFGSEAEKILKRFGIPPEIKVIHTVAPTEGGEE